MKAFAELFARLDRTTSTKAKVDAMAAYFADVPAEDAAWAVFFLSGGRFKRFVGSRRLAEWVREQAGIPDWLLDECYEATGDLAEVVSLLAPAGRSQESTSESLSVFVHERVQPLRAIEDEVAQRAAVGELIREAPASARFVVAKVLTGALRVGVSKTLVVRAIAQSSGVDRNLVQHRLAGDWQPTADGFAALVSPEPGAGENDSQLYPFFLASPLDGAPEALGELDEFSVEWKWDGIRSQLIRRGGETFLWSRGEERIEAQFPEMMRLGSALPDGTVLDGELLVFDHESGRPAPFSQMQKRIGRKKPGKKILQTAPAFLMAYDLLEVGGEDIRTLPFDTRRRKLEALAAAFDSTHSDVFGLSATVDAESFDELRALRETSRERRVEGFMLKRRNSPYRTGRRKGDWWKWKVDPLTLDCVLVYAQAGHGKRAGLFTDYSFAVWDDRANADGRVLVTVAKAYSGLDHGEIETLDKWIRKNTLERFGPVRSVNAEHVFEIGFEHVRRSKRHKAGVAVRFPRILRWRADKTPEDADALSALLALADALEPPD